MLSKSRRLPFQEGDAIITVCITLREGFTDNCLMVHRLLTDFVPERDRLTGTLARTEANAKLVEVVAP